MTTRRFHSLTKCLVTATDGQDAPPTTGSGRVADLDSIEETLRSIEEKQDKFIKHFIEAEELLRNRMVEASDRLQQAQKTMSDTGEQVATAVAIMRGISEQYGQCLQAQTQAIGIATVLLMKLQSVSFTSLV